MTKGAKKRIRKAVELLLMCSPVQKVFNPIINDIQKFRLTFITLTIPVESRQISIEEGNKVLLNPFLEVARKKFGVELYVWKAEFQARGQLHYHITCNRFILHDKIKAAWNKVLTDAEMMSEFKAKFGHCNPNSTDIHAVYKVKDLGAYLMKYLTKDVDETEAKEDSETGAKKVDKGKVWGCSQTISKAGLWHDVQVNENERRINLAAELGKVKVNRLDNCTIVECITIRPDALLTDNQKQEYKAHINLITSKYENTGK